MSPCAVCENKTLDKRWPYIWIGPKPHNPQDRDSKNRTLKYQPGLNIPNPCYNCQRAMDYDDQIRQDEFCPAWHTDSHETTRILMEDQNYDW